MKKLNLPKKIWYFLLGKYWQAHFLLRLPENARKGRFRNATILRVGGRVNPTFENYIRSANKIVNVDVSEEYLGEIRKIDIKEDAHSLPMIADESCDFVMSSHTIEHLTNPIKAISEWRRILKKGGVFYASIPYYEKTFDRNRKPTVMEHFLSDYEKGVGLDDDTHTEEFLRDFDVSMDGSFSNRDDWYETYRTNPKIYTHYHVFDKDNVEMLMRHC